LLLPGIGLWSSYALVFIFYCLLQVATNTAQGPYQGFIPDLVPVARRGRAAGVKSLLELLGGISLARLAAYFMDRYSPGDQTYWLWLTLGALGIVLLVTTTVTLITVREKPGGLNPASRAPLLPDLVKIFRIDFKREPDFIWFLVSRGMMAVPGVILQTFALYYLADVVGVDSPAASAWPREP